LAGARCFRARKGSAGTWVYAIARNTALSHLRSESYRRTTPLDSVDEPAAAACAGDGREDLRRAVERLPEELREVIVLYYYQERSVEDVALMLDLPSGTVKSHLFRARKRLAERMRGVERS
jgi:RNA polymerase sigma-70 factor, ECF subfamily